MAIASELIGKLGGGADVESTPVSVSVSGNGSSQVMHTVNIPPGETWLVAVVGTGGDTSPQARYMPRISIGNRKVPQETGYFASAEVVAGSVDVVLESRSTRESSFEGHVYTVKM